MWKHSIICGTVQTKLVPIIISNRLSRTCTGQRSLSPLMVQLFPERCAINKAEISLAFRQARAWWDFLRPLQCVTQSSPSVTLEDGELASHVCFLTVALCVFSNQKEFDTPKSTPPCVCVCVGKCCCGPTWSYHPANASVIQLFIACSSARPLICKQCASEAR